MSYIYIHKIHTITNASNRFKVEKDASITIRVPKQTKKKLQTLAEKNKREFSDFVRRVLVEIADEKIKINL